jgi:tRNA (cytidine56-2'-O)-methyltransferase
MKCSISVLRLGHRLVRDTRVSTHSALVARAFGAAGIVMTGADETDTLDSIMRINSRWGGNFRISYSKSWRQVVKNWKGAIIHLTMYGQELDKAIPKIRKHVKDSKEKNLLVVIGAEKVPSEVYSLANFNVAVGSQPHSEVAALAVFLDRFFRGKELYSTFTNAKLRIRPSEREKKIEFIGES